MDYLWIAIAFISGFLFKQFNLPPLVGYLTAGFGLHAIGIEPTSSLDHLAEIGITLLLFTIGLKLDIRTLFKPEVFVGAMGNMVIFILLSVVTIVIFSSIGMAHFSGFNWQTALLIGFAVSFSSTVCTVKVLQDKGELLARHGQVAIGILIIQDIAAVSFVSLSSEQVPSWWAFTLLALPLLKPLLNRLLEKCGHGEILPLAGFFLAIGGGELFELFGLKAHLGALIAGLLLSGHTKATELTKSLLSFKDLFLIGFFLSIGFTALPTTNMIGVAMLMAIALPMKAGLFFLVLTRLKLRSRSAFLSSLSLANYSEFGLIVCSVAVMNGQLPKEWLVIMALAVTISFIFSSIINAKAHNLYSIWRHTINRFETTERLVEDQFIQPGDATILIVGMGRVGTGAYDTLRDYHPDKVICGLDVDRKRVMKHKKQGRNVIRADAEDPDFWAHTNLNKVTLIMFSMPNYLDIIEAQKQLDKTDYKGKTAGIARYEDEKKKMLDSGIDVVYNFYLKAGTGFAEESLHLVE